MKWTFFQPNLFKLTCALAIVGLSWGGGPVALAADPSVNVVTPSNEFGDVGAALGNVWDMSGLNDITWTQPDSKNRKVQYTLWSAADPSVPAGGSGFVLRGVTPKGSDLVTAFYTNSQESIPSNIYRYLIYRLYIAPHQPGEVGIERSNSRYLFSNQWGANWQREAFPYRRYSVPQRLGCPFPPNDAYGGWCTFFVDLSRSNLTGPGSPNPWNWGQPGVRVEAFGLWPHENWCDSQCNPSGDSPDYFYLDYVYLVGEIVAKSPSYLYTLKWNVSDPDGGQVDSSLYYQRTDEILTPAQSPACNAANLASAWTFIGTTNTTLVAWPSQYPIFLPLIFKAQTSSSTFGSGQEGLSNQSFTWNLANHATYPLNKAYYVCVVVQDSNGNKAYSVSSAPVFKAPAPADLVTTGLATDLAK